MPPNPEDNLSQLERAKERLYSPHAAEPERSNTGGERERSKLPHAWENTKVALSSMGTRHVRLAGIFFMAATVFFLVALGIAALSFYFGGNTVSAEKIAIQLQGPTTIAGGDTVPLSIAITNRNAVAITDAVLEVDFPDGSRDAVDVLKELPRYTETLGTIERGETVTRSIKASLFGAAGSTLQIPISVSYKTSGSNSVFVKREQYTIAVSSTPLSLSVESLTETVSGKSIDFVLKVRSNATVPLDNVVVQNQLPFGFSVTNSTVPLTESRFVLGTLPPGGERTIRLTGTLSGQDREERVFHFTIGTAKPGDTALAVPYMTQQASVTIAAPFLATILSINGSTSGSTVVSPGSVHTVSLSYENTLLTSVSNAEVSVRVSGSAVDYNNIRTSNGFYDSATRTIRFNADTDASLENMAPGATGIGSFTFTTLPAGKVAAAPTITFTVSVSGTRVGQSNVPETISNSATYTAKVVTSVGFAATSLHSSGPIGNFGPIPPRPEEVTAYTVLWTVQNKGNAVAGGTVTASLPTYVTYTGFTNGSGTFSYNEAARTVTWSPGDLAQNASVQGAFQVSIKPSTSQSGSAPQLTGTASFTGFDRFAGVSVSASADPVTIETRADPGYVSDYGSVQ